MIGNPHITERDLKGFNVEWIGAGHGVPGGTALTCRLCGVHNWQPGDTRTLLQLAVEAAAHREVCP